jgi:hypothetical protein
MAQVVCRRPLTMEARVRTQVSPCEICGGQSTSVFPCQSKCFILFTLILLLSEGQAGEI